MSGADANLDREEWRPVSGYEGLYEVSNLGGIRSTAKPRLHHRGWTQNGYRCVKLRKDGRGRQYYVHRAIALAFIPNPHDKPQVNHIDGDRANNGLANLEWVTSSENCLHGFKFGASDARGEANGQSKLKESQVYSIKARASAGEACTSLAREYGLNRSTIVAIKHGHSWKHLESAQ